MGGNSCRECVWEWGQRKVNFLLGGQLLLVDQEKKIPKDNLLLRVSLGVQLVLKVQFPRSGKNEAVFISPW